MGVLLLVLAVVSACSASYWGWAPGGCNASGPADWNFYNSVQNFVAVQWWTFTFTHSTLPVGGLLNFVQLAPPSPARFLQITVTDGTQSPPFLASLQDLYAFSNSGANPSSFCWGVHETACMYTDASLSYAATQGVSNDGSVAWNLTFANADAESWCMLNKANSAIGQGSLISLSWRHAVPRATVSGTLTINGHTIDFDGVGQNDHMFGNFIPGVNLFQNWIDGHFFDPASDFNFYWGNMKDSWTFGRVSMGEWNYTFENDEVSFSTSCDSSLRRPLVVHIDARSSSGFILDVSYKPLVPNLTWPTSRNVEDIVVLAGQFCFQSDCKQVSARGWGQVIGSSGC